MNRKPLVTIILPAYNLVRYIAKAVGSALGQSYSNIEVIAVNDGSRDATGTIFHEMASTDPRLKIIDTPNRGVYRARLTAIENSSGEYITFLDGDDWLEPDFISKSVDTACRTGADITVSGMTRVKGDKSVAMCNTNSYPMRDEEFLLNILSHRCPVFLSGKMFRRPLLMGVRDMEGIILGNDAMVNIQAALQLPYVVHTGYTGYNYFQRAGSANRNVPPVKYYFIYTDIVKGLVGDHAESLSMEPARYHMLSLLRWHLVYLRKKRVPWHGDDSRLVALQAALTSDISFFRQYFTWTDLRMAQLYDCPANHWRVLALARLQKTSLSLKRRFGLARI